MDEDFEYQQQMDEWDYRQEVGPPIGDQFDGWLLAVGLFVAAVVIYFTVSAVAEKLGSKWPEFWGGSAVTAAGIYVFFIM